MQWSDHGQYLNIRLPEAFNFNECLELLHTIQDKRLLKLVRMNEEEFLLKICSDDNSLIVEFCLGEPTYAVKQQVVQYMSEWFDLERDLFRLLSDGE